MGRRSTSPLPWLAILLPGAAAAQGLAHEAVEELDEDLRRHDLSLEQGGAPAQLGDWLSEDVRAWRRSWSDAGYTLEAFLTFDASAHLSGGAEPGSKAARGLFDAIFAVDTGKAFGLTGGRLVIGAQALGGDNGSEEVGVVQNYSNIDAADDRLQLARVWYEQEWAQGRTILRLGKQDANALFASVPSASRFIHSSMGFSPTILGFPTYPDPAYGAALRQRLDGGPTLALGVFDGEGHAGVETGKEGPRSLFHPPDDYFLIAQIDGVWGDGGGRPGRLGIGAWKHTGDFTRFDGGTDDGTAGLYAMLEQRLTVGERPFETFLQLGQADEDVSSITRHVGFGAALSDVFTPERLDALGLGASWVELSDAQGASFTADSETAIELFYGIQILPGVRFKPDLQHVISPGGDATLDDAWIRKLLPGKGALSEKARAEAEEEIRADIERIEVKAFPLAVTTPDLASGLVVLLQSQGIGPIRPNTLLLNWFDRDPGEGSSPGLQSFGVYLQLARRQGCNLVLLEAASEEYEALAKTRSRKRRIDVWFEEDATGRLMLLFAYLMTRAEDWDRAGIRLFAAKRSGEDREGALSRLREMLADVRIDAEPEVVESVGADMITSRSGEASLVFLPFRLRGDALLGGFGVRLESLVEILPMTALVLAAEEVDLEAGPEEGPHGEIADAKDTADSYAKTAAQAEKEADEAAGALAEIHAKLEGARRENVAPDKLAALELSHEKAAAAREQASRRAAKAKAKAEQAEREVRALREEKAVEE